MKLWMCTRAELRRGTSAIVLLVVMAGLAGGATLAAAAGARRTSSAFDRLALAEDTPEAFMFGQGELSADDVRRLHAIPNSDVDVATIIILLPGPSGTDRRFDLGVIAWVDEESMATERPKHLQGRMPSPEHPEEIVVNEFVAGELGVEPGDAVTLVGPSPEAFDCALEVRCDSDVLAEPFQAVVSGVMRTANDLNTDAFNGAAIWAGPGFNAIVPPEYIRAVTVANVRLDGGAAGVDAFMEELEQQFPEQFGVEIDDPDDLNVDGALDVEARSLLLFAFVAAVAGLVATSLAFARHMAAGSDDRRVLASLGLTRQQRVWIALRAGLVIVIAGTVLATVIAIGASTLLPVGLAGQAEPDPGIDIDLPLLAAGALVMALLLGATFVGVAYRAVARDDSQPDLALPARAGRLASLPLVAALGVELAVPRVSRGRGGSFLGAVMAVVVAVILGCGAVVIAASNDDLQGDHLLYGQPWDATVSLGPDNAPAVADELADRDEVTAVSLAASGTIQLSGHDAQQELYAVGFGLRSGDMEPVVHEGRAPRTSTEVLLGTSSFDDLDVAIGDTVTAEDGTQLTLVGSGIIPIVGTDSPEDGAILTYDGFLEHASFDIPGEEEEVVVGFDVRDPGQLDSLMDSELGPHVEVFGAPARRPTDVSALGGIGRFPLAIGAFTAILAMVALSHSLLVGVTSRRGELATLRAIGLRRRATAGIVAWAALTLVAIGLVLGVPIGIAVGRALWVQIASSVHVVAHATTPVPTVALVVGAAVGAAVVAGAWPARRVLNLRIAEAVRTE